MDVLCAEVKRALKGPESAIDLAYLYLLMGWVIHPEVNVNACLRELDRMARDAASYWRPLDDTGQRIEGLNRYLFTTLKLSYDDEAKWLHEVIQLRKGYCVSLSALYVGLAFRNGLELRIVSLPKHMFVRWPGPPTQVNIETTAKGRSRSDEEYREKHGLTPEEWTSKESLAYFLASQLAEELETAGKSAEALRCCELSVAVHPTSVGLGGMATVLHSLGRHDDSLKSLDRALVLDPQDLLLMLLKIRCLCELGKHDDALALAGETVMVHPVNPWAWCTKSYVHYQRKEREKALESLRKAQDLGLDLSPRLIADMLKELETLK